MSPPLPSSPFILLKVHKFWSFPKILGYFKQGKMRCEPVALSEGVQAATFLEPLYANRARMALLTEVAFYRAVSSFWHGL